MSFLAETRQRSAHFHWTKAEDLADKCRKELDFKSSLGHVEATLEVSPENYIKGIHLIQALKLEGFTADWRDHRRHTVVINWEVRLPRG